VFLESILAERLVKTLGSKVALVAPPPTNKKKKTSPRRAPTSTFSVAQQVKASALRY
jgi:hypothetical protein